MNRILVNLEDHTLLHYLECYSIFHLESKYDNHFAILDVGSTTTKWYFLKSNRLYFEALTEGFNPVYEQVLPDGFITNDIEDELLEIDTLIYYGTGTSTESAILKVKQVFAKYEIENILVFSDILAASRACCNKHHGYVSILGTGSNTVFFDGKDAQVLNPAMGFMLGGQGSGAYIGKMLLSFYFSSRMPKDLADVFKVKYNLRKSDVLENTYSQSAAKYLASFAPFASANLQNSWMEDFMDNIMREFISIHLEPFIKDKNIPIHFVGSIAFNFRNLLSNIIKEKGLVLGKVLQTPGQELVKYHLNIYE